MARRATVLAVTVLAAASCRSTDGPVAKATATTAPVARPTVAVHDQLRLTVAFLGDDADPSVTVDPVDDAGRVTANLLGPVPVAGLTEPAAAAALVRAYADIKVTARVTVAVVRDPRTP